MDDKSDHQRLRDLDEWLSRKSYHLLRENEEKKKAERYDQNLDDEAKRLQNEQLSEDIKSRQQDRKLKEKYVDRIFKYLNWYTIGVFVILVIQVVVYIWQKIVGENAGEAFVFGDWVLVALIGSIATGVFTSVNAVMKGLFGMEQPKN